MIRGLEGVGVNVVEVDDIVGEWEKMRGCEGIVESVG